MRDAGVIGLPLEDRFQDSARLPLSGVGGVRRRVLRHAKEAQRVEHRSLGVLVVRLVHPPHRLRVSDESVAVAHGRVVAVERPDRLDVVGFDLGRRMQCSGVLDGGGAGLQLGRRRRRPERMEVRHRQTPRGHGARRVG
jgi:hypothetical protein